MRIFIMQTLSILKPDSVAKSNIGAIISRFESNGLSIAAMKMLHMDEAQAGEFYAIHRERSFFNDLIHFMTSGPVVVMVLEGDNAVEKNRALMGATDPKKAEVGTIRADFADNIDANAVHGSDSEENAKIEINFFFSKNEIVNAA
jgi:nucleoside-diphosphate kinase